MSFWAEDSSVAVRFLGKLKGLNSTPPSVLPPPTPQPSCRTRKGEGRRGRGGKGRDKKTATVAQACNSSTEGQLGLYNFRPSGPHETVSNKTKQNNNKKP